MKSNRLFIFGVAGIVIFGLVLMAGFRQGWFGQDAGNEIPQLAQSKKDDPKPARKIDHKSLADSLGVSEDDFVDSGDIRRPKRDLREDNNDLIASREEFLERVPNPGKGEFIPVSTNAQVAGLSKEIDENLGQTAATSSFVSAEPFDKDKYFSDPEAYLSKIRPSRVFQSAQPGEDVERISSKTEFYQEILQGESVLLEVKANPGFPVSYHTQSNGVFESNRLKTITVAASEDGVARARFRAVSGVQGLVNVMVASPGNSGQLRYMINVNLPD